MKIQTAKTRKVTWVDVSCPSFKDIPALQKRFGLHMFSVRELASPSQRNKVDLHDNAIFVTHLYPYWNKKAKKIDQTEINILVEDNRIITFHQNQIPTLKEFLKTIKSDPTEKRQAFESRDALLNQILGRLLDYTHPMLDDLAKEVTHIEEQLLEGKDKESVEDIMHLRRNITDFRRIMQGHRTTMRRFKSLASSLPVPLSQDGAYYLNDLVTHTKEIWERLDAYKEGIETLQQTNESLITFKINSVMKVLAVLTSLMLPITIITGLFGVNASDVPILGSPNDFMIIVGISLASMLILLSLFWYKKWL